MASDSPYVLARQNTTKNAQQAEQPIPLSLARLLKPAQAQHRPDDRVFRFPMLINTAWLIREDLKSAGLPLIDRDGNEICFHSLRNSYISFLANSNTPMKVVQKLARHSDPKLTYNTYARAFEDGEKLAVKSLPDVARFNLSFCLPFSGELRRTETVKRGQVNLAGDVNTAFSDIYELPPRGLEPLERNSQVIVKNGFTSFPEKSCAAGCANFPENHPENAHNDPDLTALIERWDSLPESVRKQIIELAGASGQ